MANKLTSLLGQKVLLLDGAMGTCLQAKGLAAGALPELWNLDNPREIVSVHQSYLEAGAQIVETNTFGANGRKLAHFGLEGRVFDINSRGVELAREAVSESGRSGSAWVAGVIGPLGELMEPYGSLGYTQAFQFFQEQAEALAQAGADLLLIQTMSDLAEARQAVLAARGFGLPIFASVTFEESGKTLTGAEPEAAVISLSAAGAAVVGANCSLGPTEMLLIITRMANLGLAPILAEPNAGLPRLEQGRTIFPTGPEEFALGLDELAKSGAAVIGGCCGTTAEHIHAVSGFTGRNVRQFPRPSGRLHLASRTNFTIIGTDQPVRLIGERINPTGRKKLAEDIISESFTEVSREARGQTQAGAELLDVNVGVPGINQSVAMGKAVQAVTRASALPLVIDSATPDVLRTGSLAFQGKALLNSVTAKRTSLDQVLPIAKEYGAAILGLTLTEDGIPLKAEDRLAAAKIIVKAAGEYGIKPENIIIDCLTMTVGAQPDAAYETLKAIRLVREELGVPTVLGVSNISHGLPNRPALNQAFLAMAIAAGLDAGILNPHDEAVGITLHSGNLLAGRDLGARRYLLAFGGDARGPLAVASSEKQNSRGLREAIIAGDRDEAGQALAKLLADGLEPLAIINTILTPALETVGEKYEHGEYFLPNLLMSAEAAQRSFGLLKSHLASDGQDVLGRAVLATVEGDIHDIGKNIVKVIVENHGFAAIDLGKDVPAEDIVYKAKEAKADIVLLSALMTTTLPAMEETVRRLKQELPRVAVMVGGAVVTGKYANSIGADGYAKDAVGAVQKAKELMSKVRSTE